MRSIYWFPRKKYNLDGSTVPSIVVHKAIGVSGREGPECFQTWLRLLKNAKEKGGHIPGKRSKNRPYTGHPEWEE